MKLHCFLSRRLSRRSFILNSTIAMYSISGRSFSFAGTNTADVIGAILDKGREYRKATDWAPREGFGILDKAYYCNVFVADVIRDAGGATWKKIPRPIGRFADRDPVAAEWADPKFTIAGWKVVFHGRTDTESKTALQILRLRNPGDVVSGNGHVGIVSDEPGPYKGQVLSAVSKTGAVELNDWSFRLPDQKKFNNAAKYEEAAKQYVRQYTVRRFVGI